MDENNTQQPNMTGYTNPQQPVQPDTTGYYGQQPMQPDMTGYTNPQPGQPDTTGYYGQQPMQPDMTGYTNPQPGQPDMTGYYGQQPGQPDMTGYYGQQPVQPDMTGFYGQQPMQPEGKKPKKSKKPMTKGKLAGIIGGGVAAVALVVCGVIFLPKLFKSDKEVVLDAIEETFSSYSSNDTRDDVVDTDAIMKALQENGGTSSFTASMSAGEGENAYTLGWTHNQVTDQKNKESSANGSITVGGEDIYAYELFTDEDTMTIGVPNILEGYLQCPTDDPMGAIANSPIGQSMGLDASAFSGMSANMFASSSSDSTVASGYVDALETVWDAAEFEKQGKAKITVNGETVTAKEYYVTWSKEDLQDACISAIDGLTEVVTESEDTLDQMGMSASDYEYTMEQLKAMIPSIIKDDLQVKVYIKGKKAVKITCKDQVNLMGVLKVDYDFWLDAGDKDLSGNLSFDVSGTSAGIKFEAHDIGKNVNGSVTAFYGDKEIDVNFTKDIVESGDNVTSTLKISADSYLSVDWQKNYNKADNTFDNTISANIIGADTYVLNYKGAIKDINKGVGYTMVIDSYEVKAANQTICNGDFEIKIDTNNTTVAKKDDSKKVYDLSTMTEEDMRTFADESEPLMTAWLQNLQDNSQFMNLWNTISGLLGTSSDLFDSAEEEEIATDGDAYIDDQDISQDTVTLDNAYVQTLDEACKYKIKGCIPGFDFDYADSNGYSVTFSTSEYSSLSYNIENASDAQAALDMIYYDLANIDSYEITETQTNQTATVDGKEVLYNIQTYVAFDMNCQNITAVMEVEPGVYMMISACIYLDDDDYSVDDLLQALSSQYYEKMN